MRKAVVGKGRTRVRTNGWGGGVTPAVDGPALRVVVPQVERDDDVQTEHDCAQRKPNTERAHQTHTGACRVRGSVECAQHTPNTERKHGRCTPRSGYCGVTQAELPATVQTGGRLGALTGDDNVHSDPGGVGALHEKYLKRQNGDAVHNGHHHCMSQEWWGGRAQGAHGGAQLDVTCNDSPQQK